MPCAYAFQSRAFGSTFCSRGSVSTFTQAFDLAQLAIRCRPHFTCGKNMPPPRPKTLKCVISSRRSVTTCIPANSQERQQQQLREEQTRDSFVWAFIEVQCRSLRTQFRLYVPDARCPRGIRPGTIQHKYLSLKVLPLLLSKAFTLPHCFNESAFATGSCRVQAARNPQGGCC